MPGYRRGVDMTRLSQHCGSVATRKVSLAALMCFMLVTAVRAQAYRHISTVADGAGGMSTNTINLSGVYYTNLIAAAQPGGVATSTNGAWTNYAGFLQAVDIKQPATDTDGDGVPDELESDNDADGLADADEIAGAEFEPATATEVNIADTDGDGTSDGDEALAGTDPTNATAFLQITAIRVTNSADIAVAWIARSNKTYNVWADSNLVDGFTLSGTAGTNVLAVGPAAAPWYVMTNVFVSTNALATNINYYRVQVAP